MLFLLALRTLEDATFDFLASPVLDRPRRLELVLSESVCSICYITCVTFKLVYIEFYVT